jgi:hypothetical protein
MPPMERWNHYLHSDVPYAPARTVKAGTNTVESLLPDQEAQAKMR